MFFLEQFARRNQERTHLRTIGPAPESVSKINDMYRMALYLRHPDEKQLIRIRKNLEKYIEAMAGAGQQESISTIMGLLDELTNK